MLKQVVVVSRLLVDSKKSIAYFAEPVLFIELLWLVIDLLKAGELRTLPLFITYAHTHMPHMH